MCQANLGPYSFGYQIPVPIRALFYSKPESGMHASDTTNNNNLICIAPVCAKKTSVALRNTVQKYIIKTVHESKLLLSDQCNAQHWTEYKITLIMMRLFLAPEIFIPDAYSTKNRHRTPVPENGVDLWRQFLERVS